MRILIQCCLEAAVTVEGTEIARIGPGELLLVGFKSTDDERIVDRIIDKLSRLRIFPDGAGKTNLTLDDRAGEVLAVSQFTLYGSVVEGNRPSFTGAMPAASSRQLFDYFCRRLSARYPTAQYGIFGADMKVSLVNDGPATYLLDSAELYRE